MIIYDKNPASSFLFRNSFFILLYIATSYFIFTMPNISKNEWLVIFNRLLIIIPFLFIGVLVLYARSLVHIGKGSIDEEKAKRDFVASGLLFHASVFIFFLVIFVWIIALGGVLNCAFAGLLTTAPVFFIFGSPTHYRDILDDGSKMVERDLYKLSFWENCFKWMTYLVYLISVFSFDFSIIEKQLDIKFIENPLLKISAIPNLNIVKSCSQYQLMSIVIFLGSVLAVVAPYLMSKNEHEGSNKRMNSD